MAQTLFSHRQPDGTIFLASHKGEVRYPEFAGCRDADELMGMIGSMWQRAYDAKLPEIERLQRNDLLYQGFHYQTITANRSQVAVNFAFSTVEAVVSDYILSRPRPEIVPRRPMTRMKADRLQAFAQYLMDTDGFDYAFVQGARTKFRQGYNATLIVFDPKTGMPYPKPYSLHNFYRDPAATSEDTLEYFFLAGPVSTSLLKRLFPKHRDQIHRDGMSGPSYDAFVRPYYDAARGTSENVISRVMSFSTESQPVASTTTKLLSTNTEGNWQADTTFLFQCFFRDRTMINAPYGGEVVDPKTGDMIGGVTKYFREPMCPSGWCCAQMLSDGTVLDCSPVDPAFGGLPLVFGRDYDLRPDRFEGIGEIDQIAAINRSINRRYNLLNRALEYEATPILISDTDARLNIDPRAIQPGDRLTKTRGSELKWLEFRGVAGDQFNLLQLELRLIEQISGTSDVQVGRRPPGIEAAAAIRELRQASLKRIQAKEAGMVAELSLLLKKLMVCAGLKMNRRIFFNATNGDPTWIDPADLLDEYGVRFALGSASVAARQELEDRSLNLFQLGLIDPQAVLEDIDYRGRREVLQRMEIQRQQEMMIRMAEAKSGASKNGGGEKKGQPAGRM